MKHVFCSAFIGLALSATLFADPIQLSGYSQVGATNEGQKAVFLVNSKYTLPMGDFVKGKMDLEVNQGLEFRALTVTGYLTPDTTLTVGKSIEKWGAIDLLRGVDAINPLDLRSPGRRELESVRLPLGITKITQLVGPIQWDTVMVHEFRNNKTDPDQVSIQPYNDEWSNPGWGTRLRGDLSGVDIELSYLDHLATQRVHRTGLSAQIPFGDKTLKVEYVMDETETVAAGGTDWYIDSSQTLIAEVSQRTDLTKTLPNTTFWIGTYQWNSDDDKLHFSATYSDNDFLGGYQKYTLSYDVADDVTMMIGGLTYRNGRDILGQATKYADTVFAQVVYQF